ncbi:MAG: CoB--CoM heterodisulfide reductase iron-sulfur subunit B family protein [Desulfocapsaceae bacterium]|nr:CoB--CoM heterodisulfide reductase iron-sulfur subunit B family protein [Desulfocapsaceae bacterium]
MKYAFFQGCNIPVRIEQYATATTAVLAMFDIELVELRDFTCCGYPVRNVNEKAYILPSARNLAIAEKENLDIAVICNCCFASLMKAKNQLANDRQLLEEINLILTKEGLTYSGNVQVKHYLAVLHEDVGIEKLSSKFKYMVKDLDIAVIQGCHVLRPREITKFDNSFVPQITDALVSATGAKNLDWRGQLECCGAALAGINEDLSHDLLNEKISGAKEAGAGFITPICAYCHLQFDTTQLHIVENSKDVMPVLLYPQLLGLCLGFTEKELGIEMNSTINIEHLNELKEKLVSPEELTKKKKRKKKVKESA